MAVLTDPATYRANPDSAWERLRPRSSNRRFLAVLRAIAAWREREAQRVNIPRQRLLRDETLLEIAATAPTTPEALARARGVTRGFAEGRSGALAAGGGGRGGRACRSSDLPPAPAARDSAQPSPALVALLKVLLAAKCERHHVAARLVAVRRYRPAGGGGRAGRSRAARLAAGGVRRGRAGAEAGPDRAGRQRPGDQADPGLTLRVKGVARRSGPGQQAAPAPLVGGGAGSNVRSLDKQQSPPPPLVGGGWGEGSNVSSRGQIARPLPLAPSHNGRGNILFSAPAYPDAHGVQPGYDAPRDWATPRRSAIHGAVRANRIPFLMACAGRRVVRALSRSGSPGNTAG